MATNKVGAPEVWRAVKGFPRYEVSDHGRVRSSAYGDPRLLRPGVPRGGYPIVKLHDGPRTKSVRVHRLVATAFVPNALGAPVVNHINGDKTNNHASNLEWVTRAENNRHAVRTGLSGSAKLSPEDVEAIREASGERTADLAERYGVSVRQINQVRAGGAWGKARAAQVEDHARRSRGRSKLTEDDVRAIRTRAAAGETRYSLCEAYGLSHSAVSHIINRRTWTHVD